MDTEPQPRRIGVVVYPGAQTLDVTGPHEVFAMASSMAQRRGRGRAYQVFVVAESLKPVEMTSGMKLQPDLSFDQCPSPLDTLIVPGSDALEEVLDNPALLGWLRRRSSDARRLVSICTGAFFLAELGLLNGKRATTHWAYCQLLKRSYPEIEVVPDELYVKQGDLYTRAGASNPTGKPIGSPRSCSCSCSRTQAPPKPQPQTRTARIRDASRPPPKRRPRREQLSE